VKPAAQPDALVATLARIIVAIERRRALTVIEGGKPMPERTPARKAS
jgi:hypothetical protein